MNYNAAEVVIIAVVTAFFFMYIGYLIGKNKENRRLPLVGELDFNLYDPSQEFLALHLSENIDLDTPPDSVKLKVNVLRHSDEAVIIERGRYSGSSS